MQRFVVTRSALAVASWTFITERISAGISARDCDTGPHERHVGAAIESMGGDDLVDNPEKLKGSEAPTIKSSSA